jgi:hypothetical protein
VLGRPRVKPRFLFLLVLAILVLTAGAPATSASAPSSGIGLTLSGNGTLTAGVGTVVSNGSALRYAMDGDFGPLVDSLPGTNASRKAVLMDINDTELVLPGAFGDHDGRVNSLDLQRFESLIQSESSHIPVSAITGLLNVTMDGKGPVSDLLQSITFSNALGLDNSSAPMGVTANLAVTFVWSGVSHSHSFVVAWNLPSILANLSLPVPAVNVSFNTPTAVTITSVTGLNGTRISNDPLGWGSASASGQYTPLPGHTVVIKFGPSFPTGDALIIGAVAVVAGVLLGLFLLRRRRRRRQGPSPPPGLGSHGESGVGPSSGSG